MWSLFKSSNKANADFIEQLEALAGKCVGDACGPAHYEGSVGGAMLYAAGKTYGGDFITNSPILKLVAQDELLTEVMRDAFHGRKALWDGSLRYTEETDHDRAKEQLAKEYARFIDAVFVLLEIREGGMRIDDFQRAQATSERAFDQQFIWEQRGLERSFLENPIEILANLESINHPVYQYLRHKDIFDTQGNLDAAKILSCIQEENFIANVMQSDGYEAYKQPFLKKERYYEEEPIGGSIGFHATRRITSDDISALLAYAKTPVINETIAELGEMADFLKAHLSDLEALKHVLKNKETQEARDKKRSRDSWPQQGSPASWFAEYIAQQR